MVIGVACGVGCYWGATGLKHIFGYDDALDCFGVHGVGGAIGALLTGVFAIQQYGGTAGLIEGNPGQVINQCIGIITVIVYDAIVTIDHPVHHQGGHRPARLGRRRARRPRLRPARRSRSVSLIPAAFSPPGLRFLPRPWTPFGASIFLCRRGDELEAPLRPIKVRRALTRSA